MVQPANKRLITEDRFLDIADSVGDLESAQDTKVDKGSLVINVMDHGAVADGVTDDGPAINSALTSAPPHGATVMLPAGDYGIGTAIIIPDGANIWGYGATLHRLDGLGGMAINFHRDDTTTGGYGGASNITVQGITFDAHGDTISRTLNILTFGHAQNITVRDCTFRKTKGYHALEFNAIDGFLADNCRFEGFSPDSGLGNKEAIQIDCASPGDYGLADDTPARNGVIRSCVFTGLGPLPAHDIAIGSHTQPGTGMYDNLVVSNCFIEGTSSCGVAARWWKNSSISEVSLSGDGATGVTLLNSENVIVNGCIIEGSWTQGVQVSQSSKRCQVIGNNISGGTTSVRLGTGVERTSVVGNVFTRPSSWAVELADTQHCLVSGNLLDGPGYPSGAGAAIRISSSENIGSSITGNRVVTHGAGTEVDRGVSIANSATGVWVFGNDFYGLGGATTGGTANTTSNRV